MQIVVNHLTRMKPGYICVAGIDIATQHHVRLVTGSRLSASLLARNGGPFDIAVVVDLGGTQNAGSPPEMEDQSFVASNAKAVKRVSGPQFWKILAAVSESRLAAIFGSELRQRGRSSAAVDQHKGSASLGVLRLASAPKLFIDGADKVRIQVSDGEFDLELGVTDIRLYGPDQQTPNVGLIGQVAKKIAREEMLLCVGLTRPFGSGGLDPVHWLQANNIHLKSEPVWQLG